MTNQPQKLKHFINRKLALKEKKCILSYFYEIVNTGSARNLSW